MRNTRLVALVLWAGLAQLGPSRADVACLRCIGKGPCERVCQGQFCYAQTKALGNGESASTELGCIDDPDGGLDIASRLGCREESLDDHRGRPEDRVLVKDCYCDVDRCNEEWRARSSAIRLHTAPALALLLAASAALLSHHA